MFREVHAVCLFGTKISRALSKSVRRTIEQTECSDTETENATVSVFDFTEDEDESYGNPPVGVPVAAPPPPKNGAQSTNRNDELAAITSQIVEKPSLLGKLKSQIIRRTAPFSHERKELMKKIDTAVQNSRK